MTMREVVHVFYKNCEFLTFSKGMNRHNVCIGLFYENRFRECYFLILDICSWKLLIEVIISYVRQLCMIIFLIR